MCQMVTQGINFFIDILTSQSPYRQGQFSFRTLELETYSCRIDLKGDLLYATSKEM
jgi:hypothetical protein